MFEADEILIGLSLYLAVNLITFLAFWIDKTAARNGQRRIPESSLLYFVALGGSAGGKIGQCKFRHKTRKQPFAQLLNFWCAVHILAAGYGVYLLILQ